MEPHQQRVIGEKAELDDKIAKLTAFFDTDNFKSLKPDEKNRLQRQCMIMNDYSIVIGERIAAFN